MATQKGRRAVRKVRQVRQLERNSPLVIVTGNPPRRAKRDRMSDDVIAILYRRRDDGSCRIHGFGDADLSLAEHRGEIRIRGLRQDTRVAMDALPDGSLHVFSKKGKPLWGEFPDGLS